MMPLTDLLTRGRDPGGGPARRCWRFGGDRGRAGPHERDRAIVFDERLAGQRRPVIEALHERIVGWPSALPSGWARMGGARMVPASDRHPGACTAVGSRYAGMIG